MNGPTLRSIDDLAQLADGELASCLKSLRTAILEAKRQHAVALREGAITPDQKFSFLSFTWRPRRARRVDCFSRLAHDTPIDDIALRPSARHALRQHGICWIEDLSQISEQELLLEEAIGPRTMCTLRAVLESVGLEFLPNPDARGRAFEQSRAVLALSAAARQQALLQLDDGAPVAALGLKPRTLTRAFEQGCETIGQLRRLALGDLCGRFGKRQAREVYLSLEATGRPFASATSDAELWRRGLVDAKDLPVPTEDETPIAALRPWLGAAIDPLAAGGVGKLGELRIRAAAGELTGINGINGIGRILRDRVQEFLRSCEAPPPCHHDHAHEHQEPA